MKTTSTLTAAFLAVALASSVSGAVRFYAEPSVALLASDGMKTVVGPLLAAGVTFAEKHSVDLETGIFDAEFSSSPEAKVEMVPVTLNYRYAFPISGKLSGSMGISLGAMREELELNFSNGYPGYPGGPYTVSDTAFTGGFHAGLSYRLNDHFAATLGAKAIHTDEVKFRHYTTNVMLVQLGLNCRF